MANSIIGDYHGAKTRAFAMSVHQTSVYIGIVTSGTLAGYIGQVYGWRTAFFTFGAAGILAAIVLGKWLREPARGQAERSQTKAVEALPLGARIFEIVRSPAALSLMLA